MPTISRKKFMCSVSFYFAFYFHARYTTPPCSCWHHLQLGWFRPGQFLLVLERSLCGGRFSGSKNLFNVPLGNDGKSFVAELSRLYNALASGSALESIALIAAIVFRELKALLASTSRVGSALSSYKSSLTEWTAASQPEIWPAQSWREPAASWMSPRTTTRTDLAMIRPAISPIPIGLTPGHLPKAISLQARSGETVEGSIYEEQRCLATSASDWQSEAENDLKAVHSLRQA